MRILQWREPTQAELAIANDWIAAWNLATGDDAALPREVQAASSCNCSNCPTFAVRPVVLQDPDCRRRPLAVEGGARAADGFPVAGLIAFWEASVLEIEVCPYADGVVRLEDVTVEIDGRGQTIWSTRQET